LATGRPQGRKFTPFSPLLIDQRCEYSVYGSLTVTRNAIFTPHDAFPTLDHPRAAHGPTGTPHGPPGLTFTPSRYCQAKHYSQQSRASTESRLREPRHATRGHPARTHAPHACWQGTRTRQHRLRPPTRALVHLNTRKRGATRGSDTAEKGRNELDLRRRGGGTPSQPPSGCPEGTPSGADATRPPPIDRSVDGGLSAA